MTFDIEQAKRNGKNAGLSGDVMLVYDEDGDPWIVPYMVADSDSCVPAIRYPMVGAAWESLPTACLRNLPPKTRRVRVPVYLRVNIGGALDTHMEITSRLDHSGYYIGDIPADAMQRLIDTGIPVEELPDDKDCVFVLDVKIAEAKREAIEDFASKIIVALDHDDDEIEQLVRRVERELLNKLPDDPSPSKHDSDCTIYASGFNDNPTAGVCTCGFGLRHMRKTGSDKYLFEKVGNAATDSDATVSAVIAQANRDMFSSAARMAWKMRAAESRQAASDILCQARRELLGESEGA